MSEIRLDDLEREATGYESTPIDELWDQLEWWQDSTSEPGRAMLRELKRRFDAADQREALVQLMNLARRVVRADEDGECRVCYAEEDEEHQPGRACALLMDAFRAALPRRDEADRMGRAIG